MADFKEHYFGFRKAAAAAGLEYLRDNIPEIKQMESLESLKDLKLISLSNHFDNSIYLDYTAKVSPQIYNDIKAHLEGKGICPSSLKVIQPEKPRGKHPAVPVQNLTEVVLSYYNSHLKINIKVRK